MFTKKNKAKVQYFLKPKKKPPTNTYNCLYSVLFCFRPSSKKSQTIAVLSPKQNVGFSPFPLSKLVESGGRVKKKQIGASQFFFSIHMTFISNCMLGAQRGEIQKTTQAGLIT